ncbi:MAG: serine hydrolase domain-containing protein [Pseudohongiellaceae bacterium]
MNRCKFLALLILTPLLVNVTNIVAQDAQPEIYRSEVKSGRVMREDFSVYLDWLRSESEAEQLPGVAVAIVSREAVLDVRTWGVRNQQSIEPVTAQSLFRIASMSKTFAGTVATLLVEQEKLQSWDTPIKTLFPQIQIGSGTGSNTITLKNIVSHTTGLMPHAYSNMLDDGVAYEKIREKFKEIPTVCQPGECYGYQNVIFSLIGDVVELSTRQSYEQYLYEHLFLPLGMSSASTGLETFESNSNHTSPHRKVRGSWRPTTNNPAYYSVAPAAGINASILDMAIWARANLGAFPEVLPPALLQAAHKPVVETPYGNYFNRWEGVEHAYYAMGWRVLDFRGHRVVHHGGGVRGFRSEMALVPEKNLGIVVLFNAETNFANDIVPAFLESLFNR